MSESVINNKKIVLVMGKPTTGKTTSLMNMSDQERMVYLNVDLKSLPFKSKFKEVDIVDAKVVLTALDQIEAAEGVDGGILDTVTFLMNNFERQYVATHKNSKPV